MSRPTTIAAFLLAINGPQSELQHSLRASLGELIRHPTSACSVSTASETLNMTTRTKAMNRAAYNHCRGIAKGR